MAINIKLLKQLREETSASIADVRRSLEETNGDYKKAVLWLSKHGIEKAEKKEGRETKQGIIDSYIHHTNTTGATVVLTCETDFVARTEEFKTLAHEIAKQIAATEVKTVAELLKSPWIRDEKKTIEELVKETIGKLGENIKIAEFKKFQV